MEDWFSMNNAGGRTGLWGEYESNLGHVHNEFPPRKKNHRIYLGM
jgi:hypothetical protein